jgi:hypothetical protein
MIDAPIARPKSNGGQLPLCVDLDGTLVKTDTLVEALVGALGNWRTLFQLPALLFSGKAGLKRGLARLVPTKPEYLPYLYPQWFSRFTSKLTKLPNFTPIPEFYGGSSH